MMAKMDIAWAGHGVNQKVMPALSRVPMAMSLSKTSKQPSNTGYDTLETSAKPPLDSPPSALPCPLHSPTCQLALARAISAPRHLSLT